MYCVVKTMVFSAENQHVSSFRLGNLNSIFIKITVSDRNIIISDM